jgi:hypothetical protein
MRLTSRAVKLLAAAALPLALAACSAGSSDSADNSTAASAAKPSKDPNAGLMTGTQLKKALAPASFFATGFTEDTSGTRDSGDTYQPPAKPKAAAKPDCGKLSGTSWIGITGATGVSFAQNDYISKNTSEEVAQEIDVFRGTAASDVVKGLQKAAASCNGFADSQTHTKVKVAGATTPGLGDEAYTITLTDSAWQNGTTLIATRVGTNLVTVMSTDGHDDGAATAKKLAQQVAAHLKPAA